MAELIPKSEARTNEVSVMETEEWALVIREAKRITQVLYQEIRVREEPTLKNSAALGRL